MRCPCARQRQERDHPPYRVMAKSMPLPDLLVLVQLLSYDPESGHFHWKKSISKQKAGTKAGGITTAKRGLGKSYLQIRINGKQYLAHRLAWLMQTGEDPLHYQVDHIDGNGLNNSFANLRLATKEQNAQNSAIRKTNTSGMKGAFFHKPSGCWLSAISVNGKRFYLGQFKTAEQAHDAYCKAAAELHGEFARTA
jgi:hypothetical protein